MNLRDAILMLALLVLLIVFMNRNTQDPFE